MQFLGERKRKIAQEGPTIDRRKLDLAACLTLIAGMATQNNSDLLNAVLGAVATSSSTVEWPQLSARVATSVSHYGKSESQGGKRQKKAGACYQFQRGACTTGVTRACSSILALAHIVPGPGLMLQKKRDVFVLSDLDHVPDQLADVAGS